MAYPTRNTQRMPIILSEEPNFILRPSFECQYSVKDFIQDVLQLYDGGIELPEGIFKDIRDHIPVELIKEIFRTDDEKFLKFLKPQVIKGVVHNPLVYFTRYIFL